MRALVRLVVGRGASVFARPAVAKKALSRLAVGSSLLLLGFAGSVRADSTIVHIVRPAETLASIAELYYGDPRRESVIVADNGLGSDGGSSIVVGLRLVIPTVSYHRVGEGETWPALAERFYGDVRRAFVLIEANGQTAGKLPDLGAEILVPHPLRVVAGHHDALRQIVKEYFGNSNSNKVIQRLRRFNGMRTARSSRGEILLVPLEQLKLSEQGKRLAEAQGLYVSRGELRERQLRIEGELPALREHVQHGRFVEAVAMANRLLGMGELTGNQMVTVQRELGTALVALDRADLAVEAFKALLERQPDLELSIATTSPKVLRVLEAARSSLARARTPEGAAQVSQSAAPKSEAPSTVSKKPDGKKKAK